MGKMIIGSITYIVSLIEITMYLRFMSVKYKSRMGYSTKVQAIMCLAMALIVNLASMINMGFVYGTIFNMIMLLIMGHIVYRSTLVSESIYTALYLLIVYGIDVIIVSLFSGNIDKYASVGGYFNITLGVASKILLIIIVNVFVSTQKNKLKDSTPQMNRLMAYGVFASMASMYALAFGVINLGETQNRIVYIWIGMATGALLINSIIIYYVIQKFSEGLIKQREYEIVEYQNKLLAVATLEKNEISKEVRRIWHDFNNHMSCIDMLLQMDNVEKARGYIKNLNASCNVAGFEVEIGNEMADIVLNQKIKIANDHDIEINVKGELDSEIRINEMDLCAILCNGLDNAIEACQKVDVEDRNIEVCFRTQREHIYIDIINSMKDIKVENKKLITTKKDKANHGIGMMSIKATVEKYNGYLEWIIDNNKFKLSINLLNEKL